MRILVAGWFSFENMGATAGDLICRDLACAWIEQAGYDHDVALAPPFAGGVDWREVDPEAYGAVLFVCGPFGNGWPITDFLARFAGRRLAGLSLTMLESLESWNPFDLLMERDSSRIARPDISFLGRASRVPMVGLVLIDSQPEYGDKDGRRPADEAIRRLVQSRPMAVVEIDTRLDQNRGGLRTAAEIESLIARMDAVITTRMHGMVLALKNGVPAVVIDSVADGAKITRQAEAIGWPHVFAVDDLRDEALAASFAACLTDEARREARECGDRARRKAAVARDEFIAALKQLGGREET